MNFVELDKENFDERTNEWLKFIPNNTSNYNTLRKCFTNCDLL